MGFKGIYKEKSSASKIGILFVLIFVSVILHSIIAVALVYLFADNGLSIIQNQDLSNQTSVNYLKFMQLFSGVGLFITPTLLYAYLTDFKLNWHIHFKRQAILLIIAIMMLITPFIGILLEWNMSIPFPDWLLQFDINSEAFVEAFLRMSSVWDLLFTLLVIAVVPAVGEELLFRGYLQQSLSKVFRNPHIAILISAFLFSVIHFHFQGLIPRFVLGILLGYLFYWSNNLWLPILAHFVNNAQAIIFSYPTFKVDSGAYSVLSEAKVEPMMAFFSFVAVSFLLYLFYKNTTAKRDRV